jgi:serine/threonine protein kinase
MNGEEIEWGAEYEISKNSLSFFSFLQLEEFGETDLERLLRIHSTPTVPVLPNSPPPRNWNLIRMVWQQMLEAVTTIHNARVVHGDLKPANFVFIKGRLKLIDFGIAKTIQSNTTNIVRDDPIGTINYIAPEALIDVHQGDGAPQMKVQWRRKPTRGGFFFFLISTIASFYFVCNSSVERVTCGVSVVFYINCSLASLRCRHSTCSRRSSFSVIQTRTFKFHRCPIIAMQSTS